jgi:hypothetical protein
MKTREEIENIIPNTGYGLSYNYDDGFIDGYTQCQQDMADKIVKLEEKLKLIEHISDEMAKDLIRQSEFFDGGFESVSKYYNYKQSLNKQD